jgi:hypothetical protein
MAAKENVKQLAHSARSTATANKRVERQPLHLGKMHSHMAAASAATERNNNGVQAQRQCLCFKIVFSTVFLHKLTQRGNLAP